MRILSLNCSRLLRAPGVRLRHPFVFGDRHELTQQLEKANSDFKSFSEHHQATEKALAVVEERLKRLKRRVIDKRHRMILEVPPSYARDCGTTVFDYVLSQLEDVDVTAD